MKHRFEIPCNTDHLRDARRFLNEVLNQYDLGSVDQNALVLAVDEICANIIIHSKIKSDEVIALSVEYKDDKLIFEIVDTGKNKFDINSYDSPELDEIIKSKKKGGIGIILVKKIMDKIEVSSANGRNVCRLYKYLPNT